MKKEEINAKLKEVLGQVDVDIQDDKCWENTISSFRTKLEVLFDLKNDLGRYRYIDFLKSLFSSNDIINFDSRVFEASFAYDFESRGHKLDYEVKQLSETQPSIDFRYRLDDCIKIYFELGLKQQSTWITQSIDDQLKKSDSYEISLNGIKQNEEIARLQNFILTKCQKDGKPYKFHKVMKGTYNFIVVNISEILGGSIDKYDCELAMYGDPSVQLPYRLGIFGLCQQLPQNAPDRAKEYYSKFQHFRETIHGVLFVKNKDYRKSKPYIDLELEYLLLGNFNLLKPHEINLIDERLSSFLRSWTNQA